MVKKFLQSFSPVRMKWIWRWIFLGVLIGVVSGFGAILFNFLLQKGTQFFMKDLVAFILPREPQEFSLLGVPLHRWMILWIPALGGLLSGFLVFRFAPEAEGHGTDAMIESFHRKKEMVRKRVPIIKTIASAITIGSGGSAGKEGPIAQIGSGFASFIGSLLKMDERERRIMFCWQVQPEGLVPSLKPHWVPLLLLPHLHESKKKNKGTDHDDNRDNNSQIDPQTTLLGIIKLESSDRRHFP